jgi:hypothetical protein
MHSKIFTLVIASAALIAAAELASAQSPTSYPWCAQLFKWDTGVTSCSYTSREQCMTTSPGIGGYCFESPYYHASAATSPPRSRRPRYR